MTRNFETKAKT